MAVTIKDIAKKAGVSYSTVSRALNGIGGNESSERRQQIIELAEKMGYVRNQAAVNLKLSRSFVIGLYFSAISKMTSPMVLHDVLTGVYSVVGTKYNIVVKGIDMHETGTLNSSYFDGIIVLSQRNTDVEFMDEVMSKQIPMVVICRDVDMDVPNVTTDEEGAMEEAMDYLIEKGHREICVIEGDPELDSARLRHRGWQSSCRKHGIDPSEIPIVSGNYRYASGLKGASKLLVYKPTAILCFNDEMAFGARDAILQAGLKVPDDVSLIGFDNWDMSVYGNMRLTTVERNMHDIAVEGTKMMVELLETGEVKKKKIYLKNKLVIRDSVKNLNA
ncbi:MAG: LacI family DNA-binding transcriptional regulator [Brotaphodocola sp.]